MSLVERIDNELKAAMKAKEADKLNTLRLLKSAVKYAAIEKYGQDGVPTDEEVVVVARKEVKKRNDAIESFKNAGRSEAAEKEEAEKAILKTFLPAALSEAELETMIQDAIRETGATSKKEMGAVMKAVMAKAGGRADGKTLSTLVQKALS
ncbi:MAG: GatB/YqeY domain-containing protein [Verrucomicrobiota bacterium]